MKKKVLSNSWRLSQQLHLLGTVALGSTLMTSKFEYNKSLILTDQLTSQENTMLSS